MFSELLFTATCLGLRRIARRASRAPDKLASMASFWPDLVVSELSPQIAAGLCIGLLRFGSAALLAPDTFQGLMNASAAAAALAALLPTVGLVLPLLRARQDMLKSLKIDAALTDAELPLTTRGLTWKKALMSLFPLPIFTGLSRNISVARGVTFAVATSTAKRKQQHAGIGTADGPFVLHEEHHPRIVATDLPLEELPSETVWQSMSDATQASSAILGRKNSGPASVHTNLKMDLFWHKKRYGKVLAARGGSSTGTTQKAPICVIVHGGGWVVGHSINSNLPLIYALAREGYLVASVNYRLAPGAHFPSQLADVKAAIAWLKLHAEQFNADPGFVLVMGESAGGHLALLAGLTGNVPEFASTLDITNEAIQRKLAALNGRLGTCSNGGSAGVVDTSVQGIVDLYGVSDWVDHAGIYGGGFRNFLGRIVLQHDHHHHGPDALAEFISASPRWWLEGSKLKQSLVAAGVLAEAEGHADNKRDGNSIAAPADAVLRKVPPLMMADQGRHISPIMIVHGTTDNLVPFKDSEALWAALQARRERDTRNEGNNEQNKADRGQFQPQADVFFRLPATHHAFNYLVSARSLALSDAVCDWANTLWRRRERR